MDVTLYSYWRSSASWRVRIILACKNIDYDYQAVNLLQGQNSSEDYLRNNPLGQVPTLVSSGFSLTQSLAIIHYLEQKYPEPALVPKSLNEMARMWEICEIINSGIQPLQNLPVLEKIESLGGNKKEWAQGVISEGFQSVEAILANTAGTCCIGDEVSVADACLVPQIYNARRFEVSLDQYPNINRISEHLATLPAFQKAHPDSQPDAVIV